MATSNLLYRDDTSFKAVLRNEKIPAKPGMIKRVTIERIHIRKRKKSASIVKSKLSKDTKRDFFIIFHTDSPLLITTRGKTHKRMKIKNISIQKLIAAINTEISALMIKM